MIFHWTFSAAELKALLTRGGFWLLKVLRLQFFLTLVSWPILLWWGLPISLLSPLGNIIFAPFLFCFLILASLIFFAELMYGAPALLYFLLEKLTDVWLWCCHSCSTSMLIALPRSCIYFAVAALLVAGFIMYHPYWRKPLISTTLLALLILLVMHIGFVLRSSAAQAQQLTYGQHALSFTLENDKVHVVDAGLGRSKKNMNNWISYTLLPFLSIHYGALTIDEYHAKKLTPTSLALLELLCQKKLIKKIVLDAHGYYASLQKVQSVAFEHGITFECH